MRHLPLLSAGYIPDGPVWVNVYLPVGAASLRYSRLTGYVYHNKFDADSVLDCATSVPDRPIYRVKITLKDPKKVLS